METDTAGQEPEQAPQPALPQASVFVSYSRGDQKRAMPVIAGLEKAGFRVWWDGLLEGGDTFLPTTEAALEGADAVVVIWSKTSVASHWVRDEATVGRDRRRLVPLSLDGSEAPLGFRQFQLIDIATKKILLEGNSQSRATSERFANVYSNVRSGDDAQERAAKTIATDLKARIAGFLSTVPA